MKAVFEKAKVIIDGEDAFLCVGIPLKDAQKFVGEMKPRKYSVEVKEYRKQRSLDANAYFWLLLDKLAEKLNEKKTQLYKDYIHELGGAADVVCVKNEAVEKLCSGWEHNGLGWLTETTSSKIEGCTNVVLYYGSSSFDSTEMYRLIQLCIEDCRQYGIETKTPDEILKMLSLEREKK